MSRRQIAAAGFEIEAVEQARRAEGEDAPARDGWRRARAFAGNRGLVVRLVAERPFRHAGREVVGHDHLAAAALFLRDRQASCDREPGPSRADWPSPDEPRRPLCPVVGNANAGDGAIAICAEELRVVAGRPNRWRRLDRCRSRRSGRSGSRRRVGGWRWGCGFRFRQDWGRSRRFRRGLRRQRRWLTRRPPPLEDRDEVSRHAANPGRRRRHRNHRDRRANRPPPSAPGHP